ncbi:hypothetical protein [Pedobacter sp.]
MFILKTIFQADKQFTPSYFTLRQESPKLGSIGQNRERRDKKRK